MGSLLARQTPAIQQSDADQVLGAALWRTGPQHALVCDGAGQAVRQVDQRVRVWLQLRRRAERGGTVRRRLAGAATHSKGELQTLQLLSPALPCTCAWPCGRSPAAASRLASAASCRVRGDAGRRPAGPLALQPPPHRDAGPGAAPSRSRLQRWPGSASRACDCWWQWWPPAARTPRSRGGPGTRAPRPPRAAAPAPHRRWAPPPARARKAARGRLLACSAVARNRVW